jgi:hypothetical protein
MFNASCPQCGAPIEFQSPAAVIVVCAYCRSTLHKRGDDVRRIGSMASVFEDYSPLQLAAAGRFEGRGFSVVGRLQLTYDAGFWNEWFIWFDDGATGWLSDSSGQYAITESISVPRDAALPQFESITPATPILFDGATYLASDIRIAQCRGGEGELPMVVGEGWQARVADCRGESAFITLDYSDDNVPTVYRGRAVELGALAMQGLRDPQTIRDSAGRYIGDVLAFACPNCGASLEHTAGVADFVYCPSCHAGVDCTEEQSQVFAKQREVERFVTALALGTRGVFDGASYTVLGVMRCASDDGAAWDEYLLHAAERGFLWLVHSEGAWERVSVLNTWPRVEGRETVRFENTAYGYSETYASKVKQVIGAFNWRVRVGDTVQVSDFTARGRGKLTRETSLNEVAWSSATQVPSAQIAEKFGITTQTPNASTTAEKSWRFSPLPLLFSLVLIVLKIIGYESFAPDGVMLLIGLVLLWLPEWIGRQMSRNTGRSAAGGRR